MPAGSARRACADSRLDITFDNRQFAVRNSDLRWHLSRNAITSTARIQMVFDALMHMLGIS